jgi:sec-independent protein translocase protein TatB
MFDIAWTEMLFIAALTILVVGPKDLPKVMRGIGNFIRKIRGMAGDFMDGVDDLARENDLEDVTRQLKNMKTGNVAGFIGDAIDPDGDLKTAVADVKQTVAEASKISLDKIREDKKKATKRKADLATKKETSQKAKEKTKEKTKEKVDKKPAKKPGKKTIKKKPKSLVKSPGQSKTKKGVKAK